MLILQCPPPGSAPRPAAARTRSPLGVAPALHRARQPVGKWLCRVVQRQAARRVAGRGDLLHLVRGAGAGGALAEALQHSAAPRLTGIPTPGPGGDAALASGPRSARPSGQGCLTGRSVPHYRWYHQWGQGNTSLRRLRALGGTQAPAAASWPRTRTPLRRHQSLPVVGRRPHAARVVAGKPLRGARDGVVQ